MKKRHNIISMEEFILNYLPIENYDEKLFTNINHYDLSELNIAGVKRVPNQLVKDEDILCGRILLVEAKGFKHHGKMVCAYMRPDIVLSESSNNELDKMINQSLYNSSTPLFVKRRVK